MNGKHFARALASAVLGLAISILLLPEALAAVGRTEAAYAVTPNGAASYTIPIRATGGINGLTPHLAISYAGPGMRSIFGVGFALSGLSYIRPCPQTIAQDGSAGPVTLTSADRYCLDGARLRQIGTGTYGASGTQYRTEVDELVRITVMGVANGVPTWFKVEQPNGLIYEYGNSTDSNLLSGTQTGATPQFWAVSRISDRDGNSIRFVYDSDAATNRFRPSYISYTERAGAGNYKIAFVYQSATQPTASVHYTPATAASAIHKEDKLLDRIELKHDDIIYRAYKLTYQAAGGSSQRLWKVQECAYAPTEDCLPATVLTWQSPTAGHEALASSGRTVASDVLPLDVNGDGVKDLVWSASGTWRYMLGGPSGFGSVVNTSVAATNPNKAMVLRWNADEFDDLLIDWSDGKWRVLRGGATGFNTTVVSAGSPSVASTPVGYTTTIGDLNADGLDDLLQMQLDAALTITVRFNGASGFGASSVAYSDPMIRTKGNSLFIKMTGASSVRRPDFNGDGRVDLLVWGCIWDQELNSCIGPPTRWYQLLSLGNAFANQGPIPGANYTIQARFGNFNDDNLTDIIYPNASGVWSIGFGRGSGGLSITSGPSHAAHATYQTLVGDYDGDGLDDLYVTKNSPWQWEILRSNGTGLDSTAIPTAIAGDGLAWMLLDQNGDLPPDLGRFDVSTYLWRVGAHAGEPGDHLLNATDGLGNSVWFSYLPMTDAAVYIKGSGATPPVQDIEGEQFLVQTMQVSPAGGTSYTLTYKYFTAREHVQGRGYLGMGTREITDSRNGVFTTETFKQDFPYTGALATVTVKQSSAGSAKTIQSHTHTYLHHVLETAAGKERYLPYRSQTVTNGYEVGGTRNGDHITQVTETHTVNTWGNSTFVSVDVKDMDALSLESGQIYRTEVTSTFVQDVTSWCIGPPLTRSEKRLLPDGTNTIRSASWVVPPAECRVTQETLEPGGGSLLSLVTDLRYDACGNVDQLTTQPAGTTGQARVTTISYGSRCQRPETITNPENHVSNIAYNWPLALPATQTDPNGLVTTLTYDGFGRLTRLLRPDGSPTGTGVRFALTACTAGNSWCGKNSGARVKVTRTERSITDTVLRTDEQFLDGLGRLRWGHSESLESGAAIVETLYDAFGRPIQQTQPYFAGGAVYATVLTRDLIGRVTSSNAPISESQTSGRITGFSYEGRTLEVTDPGTLITTRTSNVLGQQRSVADPGTGGLTQYAYHPFGELASIEDTNGNMTG
ncbi:MAG: SpvB/TcaC N-terminal domain-containing protein, partial [Woeseiaceae bacterium]